MSFKFMLLEILSRFQYKYMLEGQIVSLYDSRNGYRMDPYHRMDIARL